LIACLETGLRGEVRRLSVRPCVARNCSSKESDRPSDVFGGRGMRFFGRDLLGRSWKERNMSRGTGRGRRCDRWIGARALRLGLGLRLGLLGLGKLGLWALSRLWGLSSGSRCLEGGGRRQGGGGAVAARSPTGSGGRAPTKSFCGDRKAMKIGGRGCSLRTSRCSSLAFARKTRRSAWSRLGVHPTCAVEDHLVTSPVKRSGGGPCRTRRCLAGAPEIRLETARNFGPGEAGRPLRAHVERRPREPFRPRSRQTTDSASCCQLRRGSRRRPRQRETTQLGTVECDASVGTAALPRSQ